MYIRRAYSHCMLMALSNLNRYRLYVQRMTTRVLFLRLHTFLVLFLFGKYFLVRSSTASYTQEKFRAFSKLWKGHHQTNTTAYNTVVIRICMNFYSYTFAGIMRAHCKKNIQRRFFLQLPLL